MKSQSEQIVIGIETAEVAEGVEASFSRLVDSVALDGRVALAAVAEAKGGRIVASTEKSWIGVSLGALEDKVSARALSRALQLGRPSIERVGEQWFDYSDRIGDKGLAVFVRLDASGLRADVFSLFLKVFVGAAGMLIALLGLAFRLIRQRVIEPLEKMGQVVRDRQDKGERVRFEGFARDEIGTLSKHLGDAFDTIEASRLAASDYADALRFQKHALDAHAILSETDAQGSITYVNDRFCQISGYSREELIGEDHRILKSGYHSERFWKEMYDELDRSGVWRARVRNANKNGGQFWVDTTIIAFKSSSGELARYVSIRNDVTIQMESELRLTRSQQRLNLALNAANLGLWDWNIESGYAHFSDIWTGMLGYYPEDIDASIDGWKKLMHPDDASRVDQALTDHITNESVLFEVEYRMLAKSYEWKWIHSIGKVTEFDGTGNALRMVGINADITERVDTVQDLEKARAAAEDANVAKSRFLATMSHEIRTPMNGLIGVLHLLEYDMPREKRDYLQTAQNSAEDLLMLINDVLDFSKIEAGKMRMDRSRLRSLEIVEDVCELHGASAMHKDLNLIAAVDPKADLEFEGDPHRLRQVLSNLISNSVKFTEKGEILVTCSAVEGPKRLRFEVRDTGIGISNKIVEQLFRPFTQADSNTTRKFGGTGLGLSICKSLVEMMGGEIGVSSEVEQGASFWFEVPIAGECIARTESVDMVGKRVAICLGSPTQSSVLSLWCGYWGGECVVAPILEELEGAFDFVVMDARHYEESIGKSILGEARIILLSGSVKSVELREGSRCVELRKPVRISNFRRALTLGVAKLERKVPKVANLSNGDYSGLSVLLVDDNPTNRLIAGELLRQRHGVSVKEASDGIEALDRLRRERFDLVFMDCMMPEMDGYEASRAVRNGETLDENREVPIIAITANAMAGDREKCLEAGMSDYLAKPLRPDDVRSVLSRWVDGTPVADDLVSAKPVEVLEMKVFDADELLETYGCDEETVPGLAELFLEGLDETLASLRESIEGGGDIGAVLFHAHRLKGNAAEFRANLLSSEVGTLEDLCVEGELERAKECLPGVEAAVVKTKRAVKSFLKAIG
ncbi:MAG: PAS domain-containing protein [Verrucomicrobiota bacterium]